MLNVDKSVALDDNKLQASHSSTTSYRLCSYSLFCRQWTWGWDSRFSTRDSRSFNVCFNA